MAKIRGIKPDYWTDDAIVDLSIPARLLFIGLWNFACDNGHLADKSKQIKMRVLPADDVNVAELLRELESAGRIVRADGTITIPNFARHQRPDKRYWQTCGLDGCTRPEPDSQRETRSAHHERTTSPHRGPAVGSMGPLVDGDGDGDGDGERKARGALELNKRTPEHPIPDDWQPSAKHAEIANAKRLDLTEQAFRFRNHAIANDRRQRNWNAAFNTWLSKAVDYAPARPAQRTNPNIPEGW